MRRLVPCWEDRVQVASGFSVPMKNGALQRAGQHPHRPGQRLDSSSRAPGGLAFYHPGSELLPRCSFPLQTHENREHLVMMEKILGPIPSHMIHKTR